MENKLNEPALQQYAAKYAHLLSESLFQQRKALSGNDIMTDIPVKQVGLFVLYTLFKQWKAETAKLKSPYFDFSHPEVQQGLTQFMNLLSKHILVAQKDLTPLLQQAVADTLLLIVSPLKFYENLVDSFEGNAPTLDEVKDLQRFIKINSHMRDALLTAWATHQTSSELFDKAFEGLTEPPQEVAPLIAPFSELLQLDVSEFLLDVKGNQQKPSETTEPLPPANTEEELPASQQVEASLSKEEEVADTPIEEDEQATDTPPIETLHDSFTDTESTLLGDSLGFEATANTSLKAMLTINQKFMFINDLFDGSNEDFTKVIDFLDTCATKEVVLKFIQTNYIQRGNWKEESPQVKEFLALIDKRFS